RGATGAGGAAGGGGAPADGPAPDGGGDAAGGGAAGDSIGSSLKETLGNRGFLVFALGNMFNWFGFKLLTAIVPLYGVHVLGIGQGSIMLSVMLLVGLLVAAAASPLMEAIGRRIGNRNAFMVAEAVWIASLVPFAFLDGQPVLAVFCMIPVGFGLSGAMFFIDVVISDVIDEDELKTGRNRAGSYYGVNALIHRYSTILVFVAIAVVLTGYGWQDYIVGPGADFGALKSGLKLLMVGFTSAGILVMLLCLKLFPLHGERLEEVRRALAERRAGDVKPPRERKKK
ncbi:MAG: MFS transporter, partial [Promethearchaeota archaeon]